MARWSLGNSQKLLKTNQFLVSTIFFTFRKLKEIRVLRPVFPGMLFLVTM